MSNFFNSDFIQKELEEINDLQECIYRSIFYFGSMSHEDKIDHLEKMSLLLEKQKIMYTRLSLSDDPEAIKTKENFRKSISLMGFPSDTDMNILFDSVKKTIDSLRNFIEK
jgi:chaperonin GroEL (HSP60 family)